MLCFLAGVKSELAHGTPSEINTYISMNNCTKFGALIRSVTIQPLSNPTIYEVEVNRGLKCLLHIIWIINSVLFRR